MYGQDPAAITYRELSDNKQRIYVFRTGQDGHLYVNWWDGSQWLVRQQHMPPFPLLRDRPAVITYRENNTQRIYVFITGREGHLRVHWWDGTQWATDDLGKPPGSFVDGAPAAITYLDENGARRIYVFVRGEDDHLHVCFWDGLQWSWANQGTPQGTTLVRGGPEPRSHPTAITYREGNQPQRIYVFVRGVDGHLHVNFWDGVQWSWADQGRMSQGGPPPWGGPATPCAITYRENNAPQRIYVFTMHTGLGTNWWDGGQWDWQYLGRAGYGPPCATTYLENNDGLQRIYAFSPVGEHVYVDWWESSPWMNAPLGTHPDGVVDPDGTPCVITFRDDNNSQRIYVFRNGKSFQLPVLWWDGTQWLWGFAV
jgi:hypothetical protein